VDYPKSVPSVGLVNGKFVDENPVTGTPGSLIPAAWGNGVTQEILNVLVGAGIVPDENNNGQLREAIYRTQGSYKGILQFNSGAASLTEAHAGFLVALTGSGNITTTLPLARNVTSGSMISFFADHNSSAIDQIVCSGQDVINSGYGNFPPSIAVKNSDYVSLVSDGLSQWVMASRSSGMDRLTTFASSLGELSIDQILPSGLIIKAGFSSTDSLGVAAVTFPVAFPRVCRIVHAMYRGASSSVTYPALCQTGLPSRTGFNGFMTDVFNRGAAITVGGYSWLAIGY
jgi:hypothetical protein